MNEDARSATRRTEVIVVGGGLAGLIAANLAARAGRSVVVLERAGGLGGRAVTTDRGGIRFNLGPHALYRRGHAFRVLRALGVPFTGKVPRASGAQVFLNDQLEPMPVGVRSLLGSRLLTLREKARLLRILSGLPRLDTRALDRVPVGDWLAANAGDGRLAGLLEMLVRVSTYADDPGRLSAGAALDQLRLALAGNVWYLDGAWQTLVDGLRERAIRAGVSIRARAKVEAVEDDGDGVSVRLAGGEVLQARAAILAVGPDVAVELLGGASVENATLAQWEESRVPVRASCLDVALARLPEPGNRVAFGLDRPLYYSVHSAVARLAPEGVAVIHVAKYLGGGEAAEAEELEEFLGRLQPGWREHVLERRFLPAMTVSHALPTAEAGGLAGRPGVLVAGRPNVFLAGDWVGDQGMLADAAAASASSASSAECGVRNAEWGRPVRVARIS